MLTGSIASLGSHYVIDLNAVNVQTGDSLAQSQIEADSKEHVLRSLDQAASTLRQSLGESISSVQKFATPLEQATTSSLDALKQYSLGHALHLRVRDDEAVPYLKRAIELDPNFALAYAELGVVSGNISQMGDMTRYVSRAYELRDRASEREKLYISAHYYDSVMRQFDQAAATYERWKQLYPRDTVPYDDLALNYSWLGQFDKVLANASEAMRLDPKDSFAYQNLAGAYQFLNRYDEAKAILQKGIAQGLIDRAGQFGLYSIAMVEGDESTMQKVIRDSAGSPYEGIMFAIQGFGECTVGKIKAAGQSFERASELAKKLGQTEFAGGIFTAKAYCEAATGSPDAARRDLTRALTMSTDRESAGYAAITWAFIGDVARSQKFMDELTRKYPKDLLLHQGILPEAGALLAIRRHQPQEAVTLLEPTLPYEFGAPPIGLDMGPPYIRGLAYIDAHDGARAAAEFQKILDHRGVDPVNLIYSLSQLGLARAYALQDNPAKARIAYQDFLVTWKDAEPDVPLLKQAKAEYAKISLN
jgi:tetratricopeptide (TPR) repeat protein